MTTEELKRWVNSLPDGEIRIKIDEEIEFTRRKTQKRPRKVIKIMAVKITHKNQSWYELELPYGK
jgi:hypothetical protein